MSFGYGVGDIIAVSTLARTIWGRFRDASDQFNAIQTDVFGLHRVLDDIANHLSGFEITDEQEKDLSVLVQGCHGVLDDTEKFIRKNESLGTESSGLGSKTQKAWRKLKWDSATVNELRDRMVSSTTFLNAFNTSLASQVSRATKEKVDTIAEDTQNLRLSQSQKERDAILQWLSPLNFAPQQSELAGRRQEGTGSWLLKSPEFQEWVSKDGKTLVCQGMPGAGKTMLASLVIDHLQQVSDQEKVATAYIYCDYKRQDEQTSFNLTASVTKQLLQHQDPIPENILKIYEYHHKAETRPSFEEVLEMAGSSMARSLRLYVVVDALDELGNAGQVRQTLIGRLRSLQDLHHFNLMTTSRYIPSLALDFHQPLCMDVQASPEDIRRYVEGHISDLPNCVRKDLRLQQTIVSAIVDAVEGMFLLAQLHIDSLRDKANPKLIKKALDALPKGSEALDLAYHGAMQRVEDQMEGFRLLAKQLLGWLTYSERLMTVKEVQHALAIEPETPVFDENNLADVDEIVGSCAGLVIIDEETQIIRLVHYTTQEYFRRNGDKILASAQQDIAIRCLTYLLYERFGDGWVYESEQEEDSERDIHESEQEEDSERDIHESEQEEDFERDIHEAEQEEDSENEKDAEASQNWYGHEWEPGWQSLKFMDVRAQNYPFIKYAARYWATHARVCEQRNVKELMMVFVKDDFKISSGSQVMLVVDEENALVRDICLTNVRSPLTAMHVIAYLGYEELISELLNHGFEADAQDSTYRTPLWWAAAQGHEAVVSLLLSQSHVNVNNRAVDYYGFRERVSVGTPLAIAARHGKDRVVKLLIQREDMKVNLSDHDGGSPLSHAAGRGYSTVVDLLLTRSDIEINSKNGDGDTPLSLAACSGYEDVVKQLLKHENIQVNCVQRDKRSPLALAALPGHEGVVEALLCRSDIEVNAKDNWGQTPLSDAAKENHEAIVRMPLSHTNIEVNSKNTFGWTALYAAAISDHTSIVELLLRCVDIDVNSKDEDGYAPLYMAASHGHTSTVKLLLGCVDIDINSKGRDGLTALHIAASHDHTSIVKLLLGCVDIDINSKDEHGYTPLHTAALSNHTSTVKLLLECVDVNINSRDRDDWTALHIAAKFDHTSIVELLLRCADIDVNSKEDEDGWTALYIAARYNHTSIVELFLRCADIDINSKDKDGWTALQIAVSFDHTSVAELLLRCANIDINSKDKDGYTPLRIAVEAGCEAVVPILLGHVGIEVNPKDQIGQTPLACAIISHHATIVKLLCAHPDVDLDPRDNKGRDLLTLVKEEQEGSPDLEEEISLRILQERTWGPFPTHEESSRLREEMHAKIPLEREQSLEYLRTAIEARSQNRLQIAETASS